MINASSRRYAKLCLDLRRTVSLLNDQKREAAPVQARTRPPVSQGHAALKGPPQRRPRPLSTAASLRADQRRGGLSPATTRPTKG